MDPADRDQAHHHAVRRDPDQVEPNNAVFADDNSGNFVPYVRLFINVAANTFGPVVEITDSYNFGSVPPPTAYYSVTNQAIMEAETVALAAGRFSGSSPPPWRTTPSSPASVMDSLTESPSTPPTDRHAQTKGAVMILWRTVLNHLDVGVELNWLWRHAMGEPEGCGRCHLVACHLSTCESLARPTSSMARASTIAWNLPTMYHSVCWSIADYRVMHVV